MKKIIALTIAGSDPSGGAGIQADLKTFAANKVYGCSIITALTAQNTRGVQGIYPINPEFILAQADSVFTDLDVDAVKIGMLGNSDIINAVHNILLKYKPKFIVVDPVMVAKGGSKLLSDFAINDLITKILPLANIITPNLPEAAAILAQNEARNKDDMEKQALLLKKLGCDNVLLKGGHMQFNSEALDCLVDDKNNIEWFMLPRIDSIHTHGTGCTLSSAICALYPQIKNMRNTINDAKKYVYNAISYGKNMKIGQEIGPLNHFYKQE